MAPEKRSKRKRLVPLKISSVLPYKKKKNANVTKDNVNDCSTSTKKAPVKDISWKTSLLWKTFSQIPIVSHENSRKSSRSFRKRHSVIGSKCKSKKSVQNKAELTINEIFVTKKRSGMTNIILKDALMEKDGLMFNENFIGKAVTRHFLFENFAILSDDEENNPETPNAGKILVQDSPLFVPKIVRKPIKLRELRNC